jgi:hypothetical protein
MSPPYDSLQHPVRIISGRTVFGDSGLAAVQVARAELLRTAFGLALAPSLPVTILGA